MPESHGIWIVFALILFEGCLGGLGYVQTFYQISHQVCTQTNDNFTKQTKTGGLVVQMKFLNE